MLKFNYILSSIFIFFLLSSVSFADTALTKDQIKQQNKEYLKKMGLEVLDGEIRIISANDFFQNIKQQKDNIFLTDLMKKYLAMHEE